MPRQQTTIGRDIPLFLIPHVIMQKIRRHGEEVEWQMARRMDQHYYTVSIRTRPVNREFQKLRLVKVSVPVEKGGIS